MTHKKKILILDRLSLGGFESRSVIERIVEPMRCLHEMGEIDFTVVKESTLDLKELDNYSHVILSRSFSDVALTIANEASRRGIKVISDLDDIPLFRPEESSSTLTSKEKLNFIKILKVSDKVTCSTKSIFDWSTQNIGNNGILIETGYDFIKIDKWPSIEVEGNLRMVLFTNAGPLKLGHFKEEWLRCLEDFLVKNNLTLAVFADYIDYFPDSMPLLNLGSVEWLKHKRMIKNSFLFAVVPIDGCVESSFGKASIYKTPTKYIAYGGLGVPGVYSSSHLYNQNIPEDSAFFADNTYKSWMDVMSMVYENEKRREQVKIRAYKDVRERFSMLNCIVKWKKDVL